MAHNQPMEYIAEVAPSTYARTPTLARFNFGYLHKEMLEHFTQKINSTLNPDRSVWLYSGHDQTILNALNGLRIHEVLILLSSWNQLKFALFLIQDIIFQLHLPPYSSCLMFELHKSARGEHFLQLFYRKFKEEHPMPLKVPECGEKCPLNKFKALYSDIIPGEFETECRLPWKQMWLNLYFFRRSNINIENKRSRCSFLLTKKNLSKTVTKTIGSKSEDFNFIQSTF